MPPETSGGFLIYGVRQKNIFGSLKPSFNSIRYKVTIKLSSVSRTGNLLFFHPEAASQA